MSKKRRRRTELVGLYDPEDYEPRRRRFLRLDPDPFIISGTTVLFIVIICGAIGGASMAIQNPTFFDRIISMFNPSYAQMTEEDRKREQEMWRILLSIIVLVCILGLAFIIYRWKKQASLEKILLKGIKR